MMWVRTAVRRHLSAARPVGSSSRADDEDLTDGIFYPGHARTDSRAEQRSDRFYFINFPARDGLSAGVECTALPGNDNRDNPGRIISGGTVREAAKPGWALMRAGNPRPLVAIPGSGERSTVVGNGPAEKAGDAERVTTVGDDVSALGTFTRGITTVEMVKRRTIGNRTCEARSPWGALGRRPRSCRQVSVPVPIPTPVPS
jgi:hypothetical protein